MRDCDLLPHELYLAAVIPGVLGADAVDLEVVLGREAEPKAGKFKFKFLKTNFLFGNSYTVPLIWRDHHAPGREDVAAFLPDEDIVP